jgi:magnesium transporter
MRLARLIGPELETLLREDPGEVRELLDEIHPEDLADVVNEFDDQRATDLLTELPPEYAAQVFERLEEDRQQVLAARMGLRSTVRIAQEMDADERADFFSILPPDFVTPLLEGLEKVDPEAAEDVEELVRWPETSAGGLMTTDFITLGPDIAIADAIEEVRRNAERAETLDVVYVTSEGDRLLGYLSLRNILLARPDDRVRDVMHTNLISVPPELDQEEVAREIAKYDLTTLPVVSQQNEILGVITADDILDVIHEEQNEDVHKMAAVQPIEEGYLEASITTYVRKRAPWLLILFASGFFTTTAMEAFDEVLRSITQLAYYVPLLIAAGGNSGSQSSTLIIRGLALGDIELGDWWRILLRELAQGLVLGLLLAALGVLRVAIAGDGFDIGLTIGLTIIAIVVTGCVVGGMMPIVLRRFGLDPATSSTPFIATLVDVLGIVVYLSLARWILMGAAATATSGP